MADQEDSSLIAQIGKGGKTSEKAFITLDKMYRSTMHTILQKRYSIYDASTREDIIQDTFFSVFKRNNTFRGDSSLTSWIIAILNNTTKDYFRKNKAIKQLQQNLASSPQPAFDDPSDIDKYECEKQALETFRRENINLYSQLMQIVWNGLTLKELASLEKINHGAARQRISAYRKKLRAYIEHLCGNQN